MEETDELGSAAAALAAGVEAAVPAWVERLVATTLAWQNVPLTDHMGMAAAEAGAAAREFVDGRLRAPAGG